MSEVMPMQIRARGNAFATAFGNWLVSTFFSQVSPIALGKITWKYYFVFAGTSPISPLKYTQCMFSVPWLINKSAFNLLVTLPTIFFTFKETTRVSLEEIDLLFGERALGTLPDDLNKPGTDLNPVAEHEETKGEKV
jgi:hypothetical protein